jgi:Domain of unknown function (DUF4192)
MRTEPIASSCRISGPGELLQAVPYLLGFHPADSLVLVGLHDGHLVVTARLDLADVDVPGVVQHALEAMTRGGTTSLLAVIYDESASPGAALPVDLTRLVPAAEAVDCDLLEVLVVAGQRWWSLLCAEPDCCPADGHELPREPSAFTTAATYEGVVALPDRAALAAVLDPAPDAERAALHPLIAAAQDTAAAAARDGQAARHERSVKRALFSAARESSAPGWTPLDNADVARFGSALRTIALRDAVWMAIDDGRLDGRPLWRDLARRLPAPFDAAPLFLFGWAAWRAGDGTLAGMAADRAVAGDPGYSAADLLLAALARGIDPRRLPKMRLPRSA